MSTPIADMIATMLKQCLSWDTIILAVRAVEQAASTRHPVDETAERRRAWDREYRRQKRLERPPDPPDIHPNPPDNCNFALSSFKEEDKDSAVVSKKESEEVSKKERKIESKKERGSKIPPDWKPKERHYIEGEKIGMTRLDVDERAVQMRDWCDANANRSVTTKANWDSAFMGTWIKGSRNGNRTYPNRTANQPGSAGIIAGVAAVAERRAAERRAAGPNGSVPRNAGASEGSDPELFGAAGD